jgi:hypothetical protein
MFATSLAGLPTARRKAHLLGLTRTNSCCCDLPNTPTRTRRLWNRFPGWPLRFFPGFVACDGDAWRHQGLALEGFGILSAARGRPRRLSRWRAVGSILSPRRGSQFSATLFARFVAGSCHKRLKTVAAAWIGGDKRESRFVPFCQRRRTSGPPRRDPIHSRAGAQPAMIGRRLAAISSCQRAARFATAGPHVPRRDGPRASIRV